MWLKYLLIIFVFYFLGLVQNSLLAGLKIPVDFIFILFYLLVFFEKHHNYPAFIFFAFLAGILRDIFSFDYIGLSSIIFLAIAFSVKRLQAVFNIRKDDYSLPNFMMFFLVSFIVYSILSAFLFHANTGPILSLYFFKQLVYNALAAALLFVIAQYTRALLSGRRNNQLTLNF